MPRRREHLHFFRGSHLPVLMALVRMTDGPILELGCGVFSTPFLHWACLPFKRQLVTYENVPQYYDLANHAKADFHEVHCITDWDAVDLSPAWGIAFVDNDPEPERYKLVARLAHAEYVVVHDTERKRNGFEPIFEQFTYRYKYSSSGAPHTSVLSNTHDVRGLAIP